MAPKFFDEWQFKPPLPYVTQAPAMPPPVTAALDYLRINAETGEPEPTMTESERLAYQAAQNLLALYFAESAGYVRVWADPFPAVARNMVSKADNP